MRITATTPGIYLIGDAHNGGRFTPGRRVRLRLRGAAGHPDDSPIRCVACLRTIRHGEAYALDLELLTHWCLACAVLDTVDQPGKTVLTEP